MVLTMNKREAWIEAKSMFDDIKDGIGAAGFTGSLMPFNVDLEGPENFIKTLTDLCVAIFKTDANKNFDEICSYIFIHGIQAITMDIFPEPADMIEYIVKRTEGDEDSKEQIFDVLRKVSEKVNLEKSTSDKRISNLLAATKEHKQKEEKDEESK